MPARVVFSQRTLFQMIQRMRDSPCRRMISEVFYTPISLVSTLPRRQLHANNSVLVDLRPRAEESLQSELAQTRRELV